jgi:2-keto-4-pentenoate hydratase/2-oxohepta-3-ene-1,7-dioic acid hydratase in catechol pathway
VGEDEDVTQYILGYTVGNDVSSRWWQMPERSSNQPSAAKSFDKFAPIGPVVTSTDIIPDPKKLKMRSMVNGDHRQITQTDDLIFDIPAIIRHFSRGMTIRRGTVIMTGTPSGVAFFMKPQAWLQDGDIVEMELEHVGTMRNRIVFQKHES